jgi:hypothetical protein
MMQDQDPKDSNIALKEHSNVPNPDKRKTARRFVERLTAKNFEKDYSKWWERKPLTEAAPTVMEFYSDNSVRKFRIGLSGQGENQEFGSLNFPEDFFLPTALTIDHIIQFMNSLSNLNIESNVLNYHLTRLADIALSHLAAKIKKGIENGFSSSVKGEGESVINIQEFQDFATKIADFQTAQQQGKIDVKIENIELLKLLFPDFDSESPVEFTKNLINNIEIIEEKYGLTDKQSLLGKEIDGNAIDYKSEVRRSFVFLPVPAIYHDEWHNDGFTNFMPARVHTGNFIYSGVGDMTLYDYDVPAYVEMMREANDLMLSIPGRQANIIAPPNMTNIYFLKLPAITSQIKKYEQDQHINRVEKEVPFNGKNGKLEISKRGRVGIVFIDNPERVNPDVLCEWANTFFGENSWVAVTSKYSTEGKLETLIPVQKSKRCTSLVYHYRSVLPPIRTSNQ